MLNALLLSLCAAPLGGDDPAAAWSDDALHLIEEIQRMHPDTFFGCPREAFEEAVDEYLSGLADANEDQALVGLMRLVARLSEKGRDGHSMLWPMTAHYLPFQLYAFADGWFVVAAGEGQREWIGAEVLALGDEPIEQAAKRLAPLLTRDNDWNLRQKLGAALVCTELLHGTGLGQASDRARIRLVRNGQPQELTLTGEQRHGFLAMGPLPAPSGTKALWLEGHEHAFRMQVLEPERVLYVQYNQVAPRDAAGKSLADFGAELVRLFEERKLERVLVDVRSNGGGDNTTFGPLIAALQTPSINRPGVLFGLIGRATFSAAGNFVTVLERDTKAILLGEPTGGAPNQYGDARPVQLPNHGGLRVQISTRYHQFSSADDARLTHEPHLAVPLRSQQYFAGRDPVLQAALEYQPPR